MRRATAELLLPTMGLLSEEARELHERLFVIDTHIDTPTASLLQPNWNFADAHRWADDTSQCDLPRMMTGGVDALVFAVYVMQAARTTEGFAAAHARALQIFQRTREVLTTNAEQCALALTVEEARRLNAHGKRAIFLSIENSYSLALDLANVEKFHGLGMRMLGLTHMLNNDLADASTDPRGAEWGGLSPFGREVVAECNRLGVVLDGSHASDAAVDDLITASKTPVILSHTGVSAICAHPRNIGDDLLQRLAKSGGVIQINGLAGGLINVADDGRRAAVSDIIMKFRDAVLTQETRREISQAWSQFDRDFPVPPPAMMEDFVSHIEHAVKVAGIEHVGIGCDLDGGGGFEGLRDVGDYPQVTQALLDRGWKEPDLRKLWGENTLRVMSAAGG